MSIIASQNPSGENPWGERGNTLAWLQEPELALPALIIMSLWTVGGSMVIYLINGGPQNATLFYVLHLYRTAFQSLKMGYAAAMGWVLFTIIVLLPDCVCPVARFNRERVSGNLCYCSEGFAERMFSAVTGRPVIAEVTRSILRGDPTCVYRNQIL